MMSLVLSLVIHRKPLLIEGNYSQDFLELNSPDGNWKQHERIAWETERFLAMADANG